MYFPTPIFIKEINIQQKYITMHQTDGHVDI